jgi:hypothetical protein
LPNLFIVGAQKSGTSALTAMLNFHPQVFMSHPKEPGYLAFGESGYPVRRRDGKPGRPNRYIVTSEADYLALFKGATEKQKVLGEASTWYLSFPGMANRLRHYNPDAKIIIILRNPIDRAYSAWSHARRDEIEPCDNFADALALEAQRDEPEYLLRYHELGRYSGPLAQYQASFDEGNLLVLFYQDLQDSPDELWSQMCHFLDIEVVDPPPRRMNNRSGRPRSRSLQRILRSHRLKSFMLDFLPYSFLTWLKMWTDKANLRRFPPMDQNVRDGLKEYYREDINAVMKLTGRDLTAWLE